MSIAHAPARTLRLLRFDRVQRAAHWANATLFFILIFTAIPLYFGSFFGAVLPRHTIEQIHLWTGLSLALPIFISLVGPWGRAMREDVRRINNWTRDEVHWLLSFGKSRLEADKYNPGQKLNAIFIGASILVMLVTGSMLQWFRFFSVSIRSGATFVHDVFAWVIVIVVVGHIFMALTHREALRSIFGGRISESWAERHAGGWLKEQTKEETLGQRQGEPAGVSRRL
jgi:formate dehydrogenase subunit gamma